MTVAYQTQLGICVQGTAESVLQMEPLNRYRHAVDLIFTSPPFPLNRKKKYGNVQGEEYIRWLASFAPMFREMLSPTGSIVIEVGNAWEPGRPVMSTLALEALLAFLKEGRFELCQQFVWQNPARLPSPAQWVNVERIRVKDAFTYLWWMAPTDRPKADNKRILKEYSSAMKDLLRTKKYNSGVRPSEHHIGSTSFLTNNEGAIPSNVITVSNEHDDDMAPSNVITMSNTHANTDYLNYCRANALPRHPARMPIELAEFFIKFLTEAGDLVLDPFAGSNTTGSAAERLGRRWVAIEPQLDYIRGSKGRFDGNVVMTDE